MLRAERAVVGVVLLKSMSVAYTLRRCSPHDRISSSSTAVVRCCSAPTCVCRCCRTERLSQGAAIGPPTPESNFPPGRSSITRVCRPAPVHPSSVDHSTPPQVPQYHIPDTPTLQFPGTPGCVDIDIRACVLQLHSRVMCLISSTTTTHVSPPRHPLLQPGTRCAADSARRAIVSYRCGTPSPGNRFACQPQPHSFADLSISGYRSSVVSNVSNLNSLTWLAGGRGCSYQQYASSYSTPYLELSHCTMQQPFLPPMS